MLRKLQQIQSSAWLLLAAVAIMAGISLYVRTTGVIDPSKFMYIWQPIGLSIVAIFARIIAGGRQDRVKNRSEKATIVGSVLAIWFVIYMMTGIFVTFVENALVPNFRAVVLNIVAFGVAVAAIEYSRHKLMLLVSRRHVLWFGAIVAIVFALQQMSFAQFSNLVSAKDLVQFAIGSLAPIILASFLLTYLAISSGLPSMLTYQLGVVATTILPPIIPKYDWYMLGVSSVLLTVGVYIAIDRTVTSDTRVQHRRRHHTKRAYDAMLVSVMVGLVLFMTGAFSYKPLVILSDSMKPIYSRGSVVIIQKISNPSMDISVGDIVQYDALGHRVTHRVVAIDAASDGSGEKIFTTKGDNSPSNDPPVRSSQIKGIIRSTVPYIGYPSVWLHELTR